ncbi:MULTISPECIES: hypothetical protein [unclassified Streptomyces]|uniref:hypothetical protein n=1 Tax=unclassified Streptomyces TaxID=2593676 RepID=UPI002255E1C8|nr:MULTISPECIES: hypothetical protein [unclassified Streptomyces]MCX4410175.1 hypothetical protein [Streptomyces sp. NBC_01764]MCX5191951.1 hypothetical protein [Streptomyces sp. NBC_00268]
MRMQWAERTRRYAAVLCALVLTAAAACALTLRAHQRTQAPEAVLTFRSVLNTFYLPRYTAPDHAPWPAEYRIRLAAAAASPGGSQGFAHRVEADFDLSVFKGKADIWGENKAYGCARLGFRVTCALPDLKYGQEADFLPFQVKPKPGVALGSAGTIVVTVHSADAPTILHTTRVLVGSPYLTTRHKKLAGVRPGGEVRLTPAFGNQGDTGVDGGITVVMDADGSTLLPRYRNCRYNKAAAATRAQCDFPGPLPAGTAYETDHPIIAVTGRDTRSGSLHYSVWPTTDIDGPTQLPRPTARGTGEPLRLRPVNGSAFTGADLRISRGASGELDFETTRGNDVEAIGFTIRGKVGQEVRTEVPYPRSYPGNTMWVTLPAGVSLVTTSPELENDDSYCRKGPAKSGPVACGPGEPPYAIVLLVRIDKRVEGARGSVTAPPGSAADPDPGNNTAPVTVDYTS